MIKELKYALYILVIISFTLLVVRFYFSDQNYKNSYRLFNSIDQIINDEINNLYILKSNTENIIEYSENNLNKNKKKFYFWNLLKNES